MRLQGKVAIVTGGGRGIGRGISLRFGAEGARVVIVQRDGPSGEATAMDIRAQGGTAIFVRTDVSRPDEAEALIKTTLQHFGRVDVLVNNAGITGANGHFLDMPFETWGRVIETNLTSMFLCGQAAARAMVDQGIQGRIINIGSINSFAAERSSAAYVAAKGGVLLLTKAMAADLAEYGIVVNCLAPGPVRVEKNSDLFDTAQVSTAIARETPVGRPGKPSEVAAAAVFFASDECSFVTGASLLIDGGYNAYNCFD